MAHGIDLPYPTTQVLFHDQTEETDGNRAEQREGWPTGENAPRSRFAVLREERKLRQTAEAAEKAGTS